MNVRHIKSVFYILFITFNLSGQQTLIYTQKDYSFNKGIEFFNKSNYGKAADFFDKAFNEYGDESKILKANSQYYSALCAIKLFNGDAEYKVQLFVNENPENQYVNNALFQLANYFFNLEKYNQAVAYYQKVDKQRFTKEEAGEYYFKKGYSYYSLKDIENAKISFYEIKDLKTKYTPPAIYYYSHIHYSEKNYQTALEGFLCLTDDKTFGPIAPYYIIQIYYLQEKYDKVIGFAPSYIDKVTEKRLAEVLRIVGDSYFKINRFAEALPYLERYMEVADFVKQEDYYSLGFAYYKADKLDSAAKAFSKLSIENNELSQNALYHAADCYLKLNRKQDARMAFFSASKMDFNKAIKEDALFNYAIVTYELTYSPFNEAILVLNQYIEEYPGSKRTDEAYKYLMSAYLNAKNYKMALSSIEKIKDKNNDVIKAYQKIAYYRGLELFNGSKYIEAIEMFDKANNLGKADTKLAVHSVYWKGEGYYKLSSYNKAIEDYSDFINHSSSMYLKEFKDAHYGLAYAYFQQKNYENAVKWFRKYIGLMNNEVNNQLADAYNRTGDCFFMQRDYTAAIDFYSRNIQLSLFDVDYALFQKGFTQGIINNNEEKIETLNRLISLYPKSLYVDDALYEIGETYVDLQQHSNAISAYSKIIDQHVSSRYSAKALLKTGLIYYNLNKNSEAIEKYKKIILEYPNTDEAKGALSGLKNIYVQQGNVNDYFTFVNGLNNTLSVTSEEQDSLSYTAAENIYMSGDCDRSVKSLDQYISQFPNGNFILNAHFYKGDCNYRNKQFDEALISFRYIISQPRNLFTEQALLGASRITFQEKNYNDALTYYNQLSEISDSRSNIVEALIGQMRCSYFMENYEITVDASKKVLNTEKITESERCEAEFKLAKSLLAIGRDMSALEEFKKLSGNVASEWGAESKFRMAEILYNHGEMDKAEAEIKDFTEKTTPYPYWMAKSFMLWSDIFYARKDDFQAIQTLQSLIDYYDNTEDGIIKTAKEKLDKLINEQKNKEKEVNKEDLQININE